jgi:tetratricopeptide (TPR) repeat protein
VDENWRILSGQALHQASVKDYANAETTYKKAIREAEVFGKGDVRLASSLNGLASVLRAEKKWTEAEDAARRAMNIYSENPGFESLEYAESQSTLAGVLMDEGKYQPALQNIQSMLPSLERKLGPDSTNTADAICMQGDVYRLLKQYANAEAPLRRCAELRSDDRGVASPEFGEAANSLALVCQHLGKYSDADRYFTYAAKIREQSLGIQSRELAETLEAHAVLLHQLRRNAEAKQKERMAAAIRAHAGK